MQSSLALDLFSCAVTLVLTARCGSSLQASFLPSDSLAKVGAQLYRVLRLSRRQRQRSSVLFLWDSVWGQKLKQKLHCLTRRATSQDGLSRA